MAQLVNDNQAPISYPHCIQFGSQFFNLCHFIELEQISGHVPVQGMQKTKYLSNPYFLEVSDTLLF